MSFVKIEGLDVSYPLGSYEGSIASENSNELRLLLGIEHSSAGLHNKGRVPLWRGVATISTEAVPRPLFTGQTQWPQAGVNIVRLGVGHWRFTFANQALFAVFAEAVTPGSVGSGATAYVAVQEFDAANFYSFEVHTKSGNSTTLDFADLPFELTIFASRAP